MRLVMPSAEELSYLRADPLFWVQELDIRADVAEALEEHPAAYDNPMAIEVLRRSPSPYSCPRPTTIRILPVAQKILVTACCDAYHSPGS
jgi:hypothetical protein